MADEQTNKPEAEAKADKPNGQAGPMVITLRKSVIANGEEVKELKFREPTGGDIEACGNPVLIDMFGRDTPQVSFDAKSMTSMLARLALVPPSTIKQMHPKDWNNAAWMISNFFTPDL